MKNVIVLGSTGSIGRQTIDVVRRLPDQLRIVGLSGYSNAELVQQQAAEFRVPHKALEFGPDCTLERLVRQTDADLVVVSVAGAVGVRATLAALETGKDVALATKEVLVAAGSLVTDCASRYQRRLLPIDSEHSAIFQCLHRDPAAEIAGICLTASGGPFRTYSPEQIELVTREQALRHPTWPDMGKKITIDSATMMNKGLEFIEAAWLFNLKPSQISVTVHPQSIVHSMVQFVDGSVLAQIGLPDMRLPIQYALTYPARVDSGIPKLNLADFHSTLQFEPYNYESFPALRLARTAAETGGTLPCVLNAANEHAVGEFLDGAIRFADILRIVEHCMSDHVVVQNPSLDDILEADAWARRFSAAAASKIRKQVTT